MNLKSILEVELCNRCRACEAMVPEVLDEYGECVDCHELESRCWKCQKSYDDENSRVQKCPHCEAPWDSGRWSTGADIIKDLEQLSKDIAKGKR